MAVNVSTLTPASLKAKNVATETYVDTEVTNVETRSNVYTDLVKNALVDNEISAAENTAIIKALGLVPAYSNATTSTISYDKTEDAIRLYSSTDSAIGMAYPAFYVGAGGEIEFSVQYKSSAAATSGFYIGVCEYDSDLPGGKTHVSNDAANSSSVVQEDTRVSWIGKSNAAITTSWQLAKFTYTPTATAKWASVVILNWSGMGTTALYTKPLTAIQGSVDLTSNNDLFAQYLGYSNYADMVAKAAAGSTIINGGFIRTSLIQADNIAALSADGNLGSITAGSLNINNKFIVDSSGNTTVRSGVSGARTIITNDTISVYDANNVLRVKIGAL